MTETSHDERQIAQLFEDGDRALMAADVPELERIYADDYEQHDESGMPSNKREMIRRLKTGEVRFVSMRSTARRVRLLRSDVAIVHGCEEDEVERDGRRDLVHYFYTDVVVKRAGRWQIVASQLAKV